MNKEEAALIEIVRNLRPYESIEIKMDEPASWLYFQNQFSQFFQITNLHHAIFFSAKMPDGTAVKLTLNNLCRDECKFQ